MIEATKFYVRYRENHPETVLQDYARRGFWTLGIEIVPFYWADDIHSMNDLGPTIGVSGYIGDIHIALGKAGKIMPDNVDYPIQLQKYFGRKIYKSFLGDIRSSIKPVFIKPANDHKLFTGFVYNDDQSSRLKVVTLSDEVEVLCCDPIEIISEYRSFILDNQILDIRRYNGDWSVAPNKNIVTDSVELMIENAPRAYCLDWFITKSGETILGEMNEGFAFGHYGLDPVLYAKRLSARWNDFF